MQAIMHYTDGTGREWLVREIVSYAETGTPPGDFPAVVRTALVFESHGERRIADNAPLAWRDRIDMLSVLFDRARRPDTGRFE
jgi:hypothetical protein